MTCTLEQIVPWGRSFDDDVSLFSLVGIDASSGVVMALQVVMLSGRVEVVTSYPLILCISTLSWKSKNESRRPLTWFWGTQGTSKMNLSGRT